MKKYESLKPVAVLVAFAVAIVTSRTASAAPDRTSTTASPASLRSPDVPKDEVEQHEHLGVGALAGIGFPRPLSIEALARFEQVVGVGIEYSTLPKVTIVGVDARMWALAGGARVFPFRGPFFIGLRGGVQNARAQATFSVSRFSFSGDFEVQTVFIDPRIGFMWGKAPGLIIGFEAGIQIPVSTSVATSFPSQLIAVRDLTSVINSMASNPLPTIDLLRVGFMF